MKKIVAAISLGLLVFGAQSSVSAKPLPKRSSAKSAQALAPRAWDRTVTLTADGFPVLGNPVARVKLVEFISYTCPHCADFNAESHDQLRGNMVRKGVVSIELRPFLRNEIDLLPSLLALCGTKDKFFGNNDALLAAQKVWFKEPADPGYKARWQAAEGDKVAQRKVVAKDLGLYVVMEARGYSVPQIDACLADQKQADWLMAQTDTASTKIGVIGTPSFLINDKLQVVYGWPELSALLVTAAAATKL